MKNFIITFTSILFLNSLTAQNLYISNTTIVDVENQKNVPNQNILIENGIITKISEKTIKSTFETINGTGKFLIPGLFDAHIHLFQSGGLYTRPDILNLTKYKSYEDERNDVKDNFQNYLKYYLEQGITSVIDLGGPMYQLEMRNQLPKENLPNVFMTGPLVSTYQPKAFQIENAPIIQVNTVEEARNLVYAQLPLQPDFIKIWFIVNQGKTIKELLPVISETIQVAHQNNLPVAVHATELPTAKMALELGADFLVHSVDNEKIDDEFIALLKKNKAIYIPTLVVMDNYKNSFMNNNLINEHNLCHSEPFSIGSLTDFTHILSKDSMQNELIKKTLEYWPDMKPRIEITNYNLKKISEAGIDIATGTDAGNIGTLHSSSYIDELMKMKEAGLNNFQILKASTINAAKILKKDNILGSITKGKNADLVLLEKDPTIDLKSLESINKIVIKDGKKINTEKLIENTPEMLAQKQLNGYNAKNIEAFLEPYAEDVKIYTFPNQLIMDGKANMRTVYSSMFESTPNLHCELINRIVMGNTVIDQENVVGFKSDKNSLDAIAIYKIKNGEISEVYFIK